jgi:DNA-binding response OmpR family regulator
LWYFETQIHVIIRPKDDFCHPNMAVEAHAPDKKKVVVVEDDPDFQTLLGMILAPGAVNVIAAGDGVGGLEVIRTEQPDLVILDLMLPDMSGWQVFMTMRAEAASAGIPVIILSSLGTRYDRSFGVQVAQVHDYLTKPCLPSKLRASVAAALNN